ncbi:transporter substrate-binding domain-containing protein [Allohahella sp. A8]|uniref:transporter substrate-binding domain-containing protein n=1 Tax=Allohahella sp. A8 TaxID=3141461 RepID=UPI003A7F8487
MKRIKFLAGALLATSLVTGPVMAKEWKEVRIAVDVPYEPFEFKKPDGTLTGFEVDLGNAVCEDQKWKCEWVIQAWDGMIPGLMTRKFDAIMSSMSITEERAKQVAFSEPYYNTPSAWFGKNSNSKIDVTSKDALKGKTIGAQRGTIQDDYITKEFGDVAEIKRYSTADDLVLDLKGGRLDLVFLDYPVGDETVTTDKNYAQIGEQVKLGDGIGVALRKRDKDLAEAFNKSLAKLKENGTYDEIMKKYFEYDIKM